MTTLILSQFTNTDGRRVAQVLLGGQPLCKELTREEAEDVLLHTVEQYRMAGRSIRVQDFDGDTGALTDRQ